MALDTQGDLVGQRLLFVYFNIEVPQSCSTDVPFLPNLHLLKQTLLQPNQSQQNLGSGHNVEQFLRQTGTLKL